MKVIINIVLGLIIILAVNVSSFKVIHQLADANRMKISTQEVLEKLKHVLSTLNDAETN